MNNIFDIKRFGNYCLYDLRRAKNNYALSLLIMGLIPVILYIVFQFVSLISGSGVGEMPDEMKFMGIFIVYLVVIFGAGTKIYGNVTEKRAGSDFLMLPASTFEKWLSMALVVCVAVPLVLLVLLFASDGLMSLIFPISYGTRIFSLAPLQEISSTLAEEGISINLPAFLFLQWCLDILIFTLGAICFKKAKVAKTLLCLMGFGMVLSTLMVIIVGHNGGWYSNWFEEFEDPVLAVSRINWFFSIAYTVLIGGLLGATYYRLRTLKH